MGGDRRVDDRHAGSGRDEGNANGRSAASNRFASTRPSSASTPGWQKRLVDQIGTYADLYERNLGDKSALKLPRGANAPVALGGALAAPYTE